MELRTLKYFVVVAQELNITHAAKKLNMSQPPLSSQLKGLEDELGVTLFIRGKRHLELTDAGNLLYRRALQVLDLIDKTSSEISNMKYGVSGTISIGMVEGRAPFLTARYIAGFRDEYPLVKYNLWNGSSDDVVERLSNGLADLAVIAAPFDNEKLEGLSVGSEPWVAMIPRDHPLAKLPGNTIPLASLKDEPLIVPSRKSRVDAIRKWFREIDAEPRILCEMSNYLDAVALSEQSVGISIFPQTTYTTNNYVVNKIITESERKVEYFMVWLRGHSLSPLVDEFVNFAHDFAEEEQRHSKLVRLPDDEYVPSHDIPSL